MESNGSADWPVPITTARRQPYLATANLSQEEKSHLWAHILKTAPESAKNYTALAADKGAQELIERFNAALVVPAELVPPGLAHKIER